MKKNISLWLCITGWVAWITSIVISYINYSISIGCPTSSDSIFGKSGWSLFPPGQTCEWVLESGVTASSGPQYMSLLIPIILILWSVAVCIDMKNK